MAQAVSQRSILFPAIARGLSAIYGRTRSANLKAKIEGLTQLSLDERLLFIRHDPNFEDHGRTSPSLIAIVKLRLWKLAQSKLFDRRSTRQLKPTDNFSARSFQGTVTDAMLDEADSMIDEMASLADELDIEAISKPFGIWKELSEINMEDSSFLPENSADCFNDLLDTHESADLECLMLDDVLLGADTSDGDDEFPWDDELLYEDTDPFQNSLQEDAMQDHWQDLDVDLFQNEQYPHTNDDGFY